MKTQMRLTLPRTRAILGMESRKTGQFDTGDIGLGWYSAGRKIVHVTMGRKGKITQVVHLGGDAFGSEVFTDGLGVKIDMHLEGEKPIIAVKNWRDYCTKVGWGVKGFCKPNLPWRFMGVAIMWLEPHGSGALIATDQNGHQLYIHASDEALIDD